MDDELCRITVVGALRRVELAVPARAPISDYLPKLTSLCGQEADESLPAEWSLALPGAQPLAPGTSLAEAQIGDGSILFLRDAVAEKTDKPVGAGLAQLVENVARKRAPWDRQTRAFTMLAIGIGAFTAAAFGLTLESPTSLACGPVAVIGGFGMSLLAGFAIRRDWPVPMALCRALAVAAIPLLGLAGFVLPLMIPGTHTSALAVVVGANVGALAAILAIMDVCTLVAATVTVIALPVTVLLVNLHAHAAQCAAVVGVVGLGLIVAAPAAAGRLAGTSSAAWQGPEDTGLRDEVAAAVSRGRVALTALSIIGSVAAAASTVVLAGSTDWFALGLALCLSLALLTLAEQTNVPAAVIPALAAGVVGILALAVRAPAHLWPAWGVYGPLAACVVAAAVLAAGTALSIHPFGGELERRRRAWVRWASVVLSALSAPVAIGVFGVFGYLFGFGETL